MAASDLPDYFYEPLPSGGYRPTVHTEGAWQPGEQHMGPVSGLVVHAVERFVAENFAGDGLQIARLTFEILGMIPDHDMQITVDVVRPGRSIQLLEATLTIDERAIIRARVWRVAVSDTATAAGGFAEPMPSPEGLTPLESFAAFDSGYTRALELRPVPGAQPGRGQVWMRTPYALVRDEPIGDLTRWFIVVDTANGIVARESPKDWMFPNVELTVHLWRAPRGEWVGVDVTQTYGPTGLGLTSTVLHDLDGAVGMAQQALTLRAVPN